jgi:hypothetical protein
MKQITDLKDKLIDILEKRVLFLENELLQFKGNVSKDFPDRKPKIIKLIHGK